MIKFVISIITVVVIMAFGLIEAPALRGSSRSYNIDSTRLKYFDWSQKVDQKNRKSVEDIDDEDIDSIKLNTTLKKQLNDYKCN